MTDRSGYIMGTGPTAREPLLMRVDSDPGSLYTGGQPAQDPQTVYMIRPASPGPPGYSPRPGSPPGYAVRAGSPVRPGYTLGRASPVPSGYRMRSPSPYARAEFGPRARSPVPPGHTARPASPLYYGRPPSPGPPPRYTIRPPSPYGYVRRAVSPVMFTDRPVSPHLITPRPRSPNSCVPCPPHPDGTPRPGCFYCNTNPGNPGYAKATLPRSARPVSPPSGTLRYANPYQGPPVYFDRSQLVYGSLPYERRLPSPIFYQ